MAKIPAYCFVTWDVDLTGRRLVDEICQLASFTPTDQFRQYIMPHRDIDVVSKKRHLIKTVNVGRYRVLKETRVGGKVLKTKSELYALKDFVKWLEHIKGHSTGVVLLSFETFKLSPALLIEALKRCQLFDRFNEVVSGFINVFPFVKEKCEMSMTSFSLRTLSKILLNKDNEDTYSAHDRARIIYEVLKHLCAGESTDDNENIAINVKPLLSSIKQEEEELEHFKESLQLQNTLKPIFYPYFVNPAKRKRAAFLRKLLTSNNIGLENLKTAWESGQDSLQQYLKDQIHSDIEPDLNDLIEMITTFFKKTEKKLNATCKPQQDSNSLQDDASNSNTEVEHVAEVMKNLSTTDKKWRKQTIIHTSSDDICARS